MRVCAIYHLHSMPDSFFTIKPILRLIRNVTNNKLSVSISGADEPSIYDIKHLPSAVANDKTYLCWDKKSWWSLADSNRWPSACKADALPTELKPLNQGICSIAHVKSLQRREVVGRRRLELPTSRLSVVRSNQLSYRPPKTGLTAVSTHRS